MLNFKNIEIDDIDVYRKFTGNTCEFSCEYAFVNLLVWQCAYKNMMAVSGDQLFIKSGAGEGKPSACQLAEMPMRELKR